MVLQQTRDHVLIVHIQCSYERYVIIMEGQKLPRILVRELKSKLAKHFLQSVVIWVLTWPHSLCTQGLPSDSWGAPEGFFTGNLSTIPKPKTIRIA